MKKLYALTKRVFWDILGNKATIAGIFLSLFFLLFVFFGKIIISVHGKDSGSAEYIQHLILFFKWNLFVTIFILVNVFAWASETENMLSSNSEELLILNAGRLKFFLSRLLGYPIFSFLILLILFVLVPLPLYLIGVVELSPKIFLLSPMYLFPIFFVLGLITQCLVVFRVKRYGLIPFFLYILFLIAGSKTILNIIIRNRGLSEKISMLTPAVYSFQADVSHLLTFHAWSRGASAHLVNLLCWSIFILALLIVKGKKYECVK